ncbi:glycoside hydrolase family 3 C-terminal domain-containing protein [Nitrospirillum bahiense]|uniref:Beta-glucosidase n=1 Tax=Nitrospirillum amazonense TaxID=28077 RepID=A0A560FVT1_9PROT|nr:glycoside hydrolase family 3 C-terminal domain-containing protein [Nitrospirillum amazonense]TWB25702.1 beta-glucosidase [Nitrospirillum amazonense]
MRLAMAAAASGLALMAGWAAAGETPSQADAKAQALLEQMTQDEKIGLLHGPMLALVQRSKRPDGVVIGAGYIAGVPRLGIPALTETDASLGVSNLNNQRPGDVATALPSGLAVASSWDPEVAYRGGAMIGAEARAKGFNVMLAGGVNLVRDPRGGRNFEYLGEDPLLAGRLAGRSIAGVQSNHIVATIKHFSMNDQETGRNVLSVNMAEAPIRESDLLAFQIGIETGDPGSVMCGYNRVNGVYACENPFLLNDVLRRDWGFKGWVMSDWGAVHSTEALVHGLDQQSGDQLDLKKYFSTSLEEEIAQGRIPQVAVDTAVRRIVRTLFARGVIDNPAIPGDSIDYDAHAAVAQATAEAGMVLLRNERDVLPLAATAKRIAVIGGHADIGVLSGGGSSQVTPVGGFALVVKRPGTGASSFASRSYGPSSPLAALRAARPDATVEFNDGHDPVAAAAMAHDADVAIVFVEKWATEAEDAKDLALEDGQDALIAAVAAANSRTIVVLETGNAISMPWRDQVQGILAAWFPGQRGGEAIARVLTGAVNPSGRLPITFPASEKQLPNPMLPGGDAQPADKETRAVYGIQAGLKPFDISYPEGSDVGYRWFAKTGARPLYAFGYGLSYTRFRYDGLKIAGGDTLRVRFTATNTGGREGADVPQVYVSRNGRAKRLIGWDKPTLKPGESREVTVTADPRVIGDFDAKAQRWVVPAGDYRVEVGASAEDVALAGMTHLGRQTIKP